MYNLCFYDVGNILVHVWYSPAGFPLSYEVIYLNCDDSNQIPKSAILVKKSQLLALNISSFSSNCVAICSISFVQKKVLFISAYCSPNCDMTDILKNIQTAIDKIKPNYYLIAMDSNAHSNVWYDRRNDERGHEILEFIAKNDLILLNNNEEEPTFDSSRGQSSIDLTLININFANFVHNRQLLPVDSQSDHKYITFSIADKPIKMMFKSTVKYNTKRADWESLLRSFAPTLSALNEELTLISDSLVLEEFIAKYTKLLSEK